MAGEIALWFRVLAALSKDKTLVPRTLAGSQVPITLALRGPNSSSGLCRYSHMCTYTHM